MTEVDEPFDPLKPPLLAHLIELRQRLIYALLAVFVGFAVSYAFAPQIYTFLVRPLAEASGDHHRLIYTGLTEAFFTYLKVSMFGGAFLSFPIIAIQIWLFVAPGLYRSEKRAMLPFLVATPILFFLGGGLAYYFVFPFAWSFFLSFEIPAGSGGLPIQLDAKVGEYLDLVMKLIFAFGITFELPVLLTLLAKVGIVSSESLKKFRRYAYVGMFVVAAILAPPDVITQVGLAVPLILLYEISIITARMVQPKPVGDTDDA